MVITPQLLGVQNLTLNTLWAKHEKVDTTLVSMKK